MTRHPPVDDAQAQALTAAVGALMRRLKPEPGLLAGGAYADLHVNDVGLLSMLAEAGDWTVCGLAQTLDAPDSTVSSALDRLEKRGLAARRRRTSDRRVMRVELTPAGLALAQRLRTGQMETSRSMLARLTAEDRAQLVRLMAAVAQGDD